MEQELMIRKEERDYPKIKVKKEEGEAKWEKKTSQSEVKTLMFQFAFSSQKETF